MSISGSMFTGTAGLKAHSEAMQVTSDNIANVNTVGFKKSRANFADVLGSVVGGTRAGRGSRIASVQTSFNQGALLGTGNLTDLSVQGEGFFIVSGVHEGVRADYFTRAGQFKFDGDGYMVNASGLRVQGYGIDAAGNLVNTVDDILVETASIPPNASTSVTIVANLDADDTVSSTAFDITDPAGTSDYSTSLTIYDALGSAHQLEFYFKKTQSTPTPAWDFHVVTASADLDPPPAGTFALLDSGSLAFNSDGSLNTNSLTSVTVPWAGAATATIDLDLGSGSASGGSGVDGVTTYAIESATTFLSQDGYGSGDIAGLQVDEEGTVSGLFTNGQRRTLARVAMARFASNEGLERRGNSLFAMTTGSGEPVIGHASSGGRGVVVSGSLEASNVDLAEEFVNLITIQRGFQANSRTITTADDMLSEVVNLKR